MPFCPQCRTEYLIAVRRCPDCDLALVEHLSEPPIAEQEPYKLVSAYTAQDIYEANIIKTKLEEAQIKCFVGYEMGPAYPIGPVEVRVPEHHLLEAREFIEEFQRTVPLPEEGPDS